MKIALLVVSILNLILSVIALRRKGGMSFTLLRLVCAVVYLVLSIVYFLEVIK